MTVLWVTHLNICLPRIPSSLIQNLACLQLFSCFHLLDHLLWKKISIRFLTTFRFGGVSTLSVVAPFFVEVSVSSSSSRSTWTLTHWRITLLCVASFSRDWMHSLTSCELNSMLSSAHREA